MRFSAVLLAPALRGVRTAARRTTRGPVCGTLLGRDPPITRPVCESCGDPLPSWRSISVELRRVRAAGGAPCTSRRPRDRRLRGHAARDRARLKYDGRRSLAEPLARAADAARRRRARRTRTSLVPVPLTVARQRARGFNQAAEIARHLADPVPLDALRRARATAVADRPSRRAASRERARRVRAAPRRARRRRIAWWCSSTM